MENCTCTNSGENLGSPNCVETMKYANGFLMASLVDDAGADNYIPALTVVNDAYITARLNDTDPSQRWQFFPNVKNAVIGERGDDVFESFEDGSQTFVEEGVASTSFILAAQSTTMVGKIKSHRCNQNGFMWVDKDGRIWGRESAGALYFVAMEPQSMSVKATYPTPTTGFNIPVSWKWRKDMFDENIGFWDNSVVWSNKRSIIDVSGDLFTPVTTTSMVIDFSFDFGAANSKSPWEGAVVADFTLYNVTDSASITITSVTESTTVEGRYTFVFPAQTSADVLTLSGSKSGFDLSTLPNIPLIVA